MTDHATTRSELASELLRTYDAAGRLPLLTARPNGVASLGEAYAIAD